MKCKMSLSILASFLSSALFAKPIPAPAATPLFEWQGKTYSDADLDAREKQELYEIEKERAKKIERLTSDVIYKLYLEDESKKKKKSTTELEALFLNAGEVSEKEAKAWFDANKAMIGDRDFNQIKQEIIGFLNNQKKELKRQALVNQVKNSGKFLSKIEMPVAPKVTLDVDGFPTKGPKDAKVTIIEFADYQCSHCKRAAESLKVIAQKYASKVKFVYLDFPLHPGGPSTVVAYGASCADAQGKFWDYHYLAFEKQATLSDKSPEEFAKKLGLNVEKFNKCLSDPKTLAKIQKSKELGEKIGINSTPTIFVNNMRHEEGYGVETLEKVIKNLL